MTDEPELKPVPHPNDFKKEELYAWVGRHPILTFLIVLFLFAFARKAFEPDPYANYTPEQRGMMRVMDYERQRRLETADPNDLAIRRLCNAAHGRDC